MRARWTRTRIPVATRTPGETWEGETHDAAPGLGIVKQVDKETGYCSGWNVTHLASGRAINRFSHLGRNKARAAMMKLAEVLDWTGDTQQVLAANTREPVHKRLIAIAEEYGNYAR